MWREDDCPRLITSSNGGRSTVSRRRLIEFNSGVTQAALTIGAAGVQTNAFVSGGILSVQVETNPIVLNSSILGPFNLAVSYGDTDQGFINSIAVTLTNLVAIPVFADSTLTLNATIWRNTRFNPANTFFPTSVTASAVVDLTAGVAVGATYRLEASGFNEPVNFGDRLLLVISVSDVSAGASALVNITPSVSGGIAIA